jgi:hypothetical protein
MNSYETSATVEDQGRVQVVGVPFAAGTQVEVTISPKRQSDQTVVPLDEEALATSRERMRALFSTIKGFRMALNISREEIHHPR